MKILTRQTGLTLIELMISMAIGLVVISAALGVMVSNKSAFTFAGNEVRIQENGRFSGSYLKSYIKLAGFTDAFDPVKAGQPGLDEVIYPASMGCTGGMAGNCSIDGPVTDRLTMSYHVPSQEIALNNNFVTCNGFVVTAANAGAVFHVADSFYMNVPNNTLECQSFNLSNGVNVPLGPPLVLTGGIGGFQVLYGVYTDTDAETVAVNQQLVYMNATQFAAVPSLNSARVRSIKYAMLMASDTNTGDTTQVTDTYFLLDAPQIDVVNGPMAKVFTSTSLLRNGGI